MVSDEEEVAMAAVRSLILLGFNGAIIGDSELPDALIYCRRNMDVMDAVQVFGPDLAEAARIVGGKVVGEAYGTITEVVATIVSWPSIRSADSEFVM